MDDETAARLADLEAHVDWLYQHAGREETGLGLKEAKDAVDRLG